MTCERHGLGRKGTHLSMQELSVDVVEPTIDCMIVLKKSGQIGVVQKSPGEGKYEVLMQTKKTRKIKDKDMLILHPGPVRSWELYEVLESPMKATAAKIKEARRPPRLLLIGMFCPSHAIRHKECREAKYHHPPRLTTTSRSMAAQRTLRG